jgi:hypothetical protein
VGTVCSTRSWWANFLDHGERAIALGAEGLHRGGVEGCAIAPVADGQIGDDVAVGGRENDHVLLVAAGGEEDVVLRVERQAGASAALLERSYLPIIFMVLASMTAMAALSSMST